MLPMVDEAEQARAIVRVTQFPPRGKRSFGARRATDRYGREYKDIPIMVIAQIETMEGVKNAEQIIALDGIDMLFFGPDDMRVALGLPMSTPVNESAPLREAMQRTAAAARSASKWAGTVAVTPAAASMAIELGFQMIVGGADAMFLRMTAADKLAELRKAVPGLGARPNSPAH
jgi:4-hydroxy-2-oxoheptanedioate aldolase